MKKVVVPVILSGLAVFFSGCASVKPIITPQEYQAACWQSPTGPKDACAERVCGAFQEIVTGYYDGMPQCRQACKERGAALTAAAGGCADKVKSAEDACLEFCQRKFYRCNCDKSYSTGASY